MFAQINKTVAFAVIVASLTAVVVAFVLRPSTNRYRYEVVQQSVGQGQERVHVLKIDGEAGTYSFLEQTAANKATAP